MSEPIYYVALSTAFLGSGHCIGMCGPIISALSLGLGGSSSTIWFQLLYNLGRISTYCVIGLAAGWLGTFLYEDSSYQLLAGILLIASDLFVILLGLAAMGVFSGSGPIRLEWKGVLQAMTRAVISFRSLPGPLAALPLGLVMGFLPCGFLYAVVLTSSHSGSAIKGGMTMLFFGLGTVPALFLFGSAAHLFTRTARSWMFRGAGLLVVLTGSYNLYRHLVMGNFF